MNKYASTPKRKAAALARDRTEKVKAYKQVYKSSAVGKAVQSRANVTPARVQRQVEKRKKDHGFRMRGNISTKLSQMLKGRYTSKTILKYTEFTSIRDIEAFFESQLHSGMTLENYGTFWHIDHKIACAHYSRDESDMKRLWRKANLQPMIGTENMSKGVIIPSEDELLAIGKHVWPMSWNGEAPDQKKRVELYRRAHPRSAVFAKLVW